MRTEQRQTDAGSDDKRDGFPDLRSVGGLFRNSVEASQSGETGEAENPGDDEVKVSEHGPNITRGQASKPARYTRRFCSTLCTTLCSASWHDCPNN